MTGKQSSAMDKAERLILKKNITPPKAALMAGIQLQSIYRTAWYKAYRAEQKLSSK